MARTQGLNGADVDFETTWQVLERAFGEIHTKNASALSFEELYRNAYKIVLKKKGDELYNKVAQFEERWLGETVRTQIVRLLSAPLLMPQGLSRSLATSSERRVEGERFLRSLKQAWEDHQICMGMLTDVLMYMVSKGYFVSIPKARLTLRIGSRILYRSPSAFDLRQIHVPLPRPDPPNTRPTRSA